MAKAKYGYRHQKERERWAPVVAAGQAYCCEPVCLMPDRWIRPGSRWHLSHDRSGTVWIGVSHYRCNTTEGGKRGYIASRAKGKGKSYRRVVL